MRGGLFNKQREQIIPHYYECSGMRGVQGVFGISRPTLSKWLKKDESNPPIEETLLPAQSSDELELDELWSFVLKKSKKRWLWTALCRRTRQIIAHVIGDRSAKTCRKLWKLIPDEYKVCCS